MHCVDGRLIGTTRTPRIARSARHVLGSIWRPRGRAHRAAALPERLWWRAFSARGASLAGRQQRRLRAEALLDRVGDICVACRRGPSARQREPDSAKRARSGPRHQCDALGLGRRGPKPRAATWLRDGHVVFDLVYGWARPRSCTTPARRSPEADGSACCRSGRARDRHLGRRGPWAVHAPREHAGGAAAALASSTRGGEGRW